MISCSAECLCFSARFADLDAHIQSRNPKPYLLCTLHNPARVRLSEESEWGNNGGNVGNRCCTIRAKAHTLQFATCAKTILKTASRSLRFDVQSHVQAIMSAE